MDDYNQIQENRNDEESSFLFGEERKSLGNDPRMTIEDDGEAYQVLNNRSQGERAMHGVNAVSVHRQNLQGGSNVGDFQGGNSIEDKDQRLKNISNSALYIQQEVEILRQRHPDKGNQHSHMQDTSNQYSPVLRSPSNYSNYAVGMSLMILTIFMCVAASKEPTPEGKETIQPRILTQTPGNLSLWPTDLSFLEKTCEDALNRRDSKMTSAELYSKGEDKHGIKGASNLKIQSHLLSRIVSFCERDNDCINDLVRKLDTNDRAYSFGDYQEKTLH
jgi:hypothetical protein